MMIYYWKNKKMLKQKANIITCSLKDMVPRRGRSSLSLSVVIISSIYKVLEKKRRFEQHVIPFLDDICFNRMQNVRCLASYALA